MKVCGRNCFQCPFPDCIMEDVTQEECAAAKKRDLELITPEERDRARWRAYYYAHREQRLDRQKEYWQTHKEEINRKRRETYFEKKAQRKITFAPRERVWGKPETWV